MRASSRIAGWPWSIAVAACVGGCADREPDSRPAGAEQTVATRTLDAGAAALQTHAPLAPMNVYLVGFHPMKDHPEQQVEAHHFCHQVNEEFAQCALFDGNTRDANLTGIEYIISERLFTQLPADEQAYWHPHNYEILSGQLVAPGIPERVERELMEGKMNSYGKTWHVWTTGGTAAAADPLPYGDAMLAWSFNRDGEAEPSLITERDAAFEIDTAEIREARSELARLANPQSGVDALHGQFGETQAIPGVEESAGVADAVAPARPTRPE